jgi:hypothetical protein
MVDICNITTTVHTKVMEELDCPNFVKPLKRACPTRYLFVSNADTESPTLKLDLEELFGQFGEMDLTFGPVFVSKSKVLSFFDSSL